MAYSLSNKVYVGSYQFNNSEIVLNSLKGTFSVDTLGNELAIDEFSVMVRYDPHGSSALIYAPVGNDGYKLRNGSVYALWQPEAKDYMRELTWGTSVLWICANAVMAKGYLKSVQRISKYGFKITCMSGIGLLDTKVHVGGIYSGTTAATILSSIIGNTFPYSVANDVSSTLVWGHLPYDTARNNLHRLLFAIGASIIRDANGDYVVQFLDDTLVSVPESRVALGGKSENAIPIDGVEVVEHTFYEQASNEYVTLFDNSASSYVDHLQIIFDNAPIYGLTTTGTLTINESTVNHAVVTGVGTLQGKPYTHNELVIYFGEGKKNIKRVTSNRLISFANSNYIAKRVYDYYSSAKKLEAKIQLDGEKPGNLLSLKDAFGDAVIAYMTQMDVSVTSVKAAQCKLIAGFVPSDGGNSLTHRAFFVGSRSWTVPAGVTRIRLVLVGGGGGGSGGFDGANGLKREIPVPISLWEDDYSTPGLYWIHYLGENVDSGYSGDDEAFLYYAANQPPASGGAAGLPGEKAPIVIADLTVEPGDVINIACGSGGAGGARNGGLGSAGTPTVAQCTRFGTLSSADGLSQTNGYYDPISGDTYGTDGERGVRGANGGVTDTISLHGRKGGNGRPGASAGANIGGQGGTGIISIGHFNEIPFTRYSASGGAGGGAAYGADGGDGGDAHVENVIYIHGGDGGAGANAAAPPQAYYGCGGGGGNGGGGGGNPGGMYTYDPNTYVIWTESVPNIGASGIGGKGSNGGRGGNGCALIYY